MTTIDLGIHLPITGQNASPEHICAVAERAEEIGLASVWTYERLMRPAEPFMFGVGPMPLPESSSSVFDPLETLSFVAARTSRIQLGTSVVNSLFHNPVVLAKRLATVDRLSNGRLLAGIGQGWMAQEYEAAGLPQSRRGAGFAEHIEAMRAVWGPNPVRYEGRVYQIPEAEIGPKPVRADGPTVLVGAAAPAAIERAGRMGLGLTLVIFDWDMTAGLLDAYRKAYQAPADQPPAPVVVQVNGTITEQAQDERMPLTGSLDQVIEDLSRLEALGARHVIWNPLDADTDEQLARLEELKQRIA
ncbi:LLM class oxidoreductase [Flindersiella endophytica]